MNLPGRPRINLLPFPIPGIYPRTIPGSKGVAGDAGDVADGGIAEGLVFGAVRIPEIDPSAVTGDEESGAVSLHFADGTGAECLVLMARVIIEIHPGACVFYAGNLVCTGEHCQRHECNVQNLDHGHAYLMILLQNLCPGR